MDYTIEWIIPQRVLTCQIVGDMNVEDAQQLANRMEEELRAGVAPVHAIFDVSQLGKFPTSVSHLNTMSRWVYQPEMGWLITINAGRVMAFLTNVVTNMAGVKHRTAADMNEALQVLRRMDVSLSDSLVS